MDNQPTCYTVTDGKMVLVLEVAEEGGFVVTAPDIKGLITEANTLEEAFEMARDAAVALHATNQPVAGKPKKRPNTKSQPTPKKQQRIAEETTGIVYVAASKVKQGAPARGRFSHMKQLVKRKGKTAQENDG